MSIPKDAIVLAIDSGGHRQLLKKTNPKAEDLGELEVGYKDGMNIDDLNKACISAADSLLKGDKNDLYGIVQGSSGIPQKDGRFTNNPNTPKSMGGIIATLPALAQHYGLSLQERCAWENDCTSGALTAISPFGWGRSQFKVSERAVAPENKTDPFLFRRADRPGDNFNEHYTRVGYRTQSSGWNIGDILYIDDGSFQRYIVIKGEFGTIPENGHRGPLPPDPWGYRVKCGCGGWDHVEAGLAGGTGEGGISWSLRNAVEKGALKSGDLYDMVVATPNDKDGNTDLAKKFYQLYDKYLRGECKDENVKLLADWVIEQEAWVIGFDWGVAGFGKMEWGGSMMKDREHILIPAINKVLDNPQQYANQPKDFTTFPDIAVAKNCGVDYIWMGPIFLLDQKEKFYFTGAANYRD